MKCQAMFSHMVSSPKYASKNLVSAPGCYYVLALNRAPFFFVLIGFYARFRDINYMYTTTKQPA